MSRSRSRHKVTNGQTTSSAKKKRQGSANKSGGGKSGQVSQNKSEKNMSKNNPINRKRKKPILESPSKKKKFNPDKSQRKNRRKSRERTLINVTLVPESFACSTPFRTIIGDTPEFEQATPIHTEALPQQYSEIVSAENFTEVTNDGPATNTRSVKRKRKPKQLRKWKGRNTGHQSVIIINDEPTQIINIDSETDGTIGSKTVNKVQENLEFTLTQIIASKNEEVFKESPIINQPTENNNEVQNPDPSVMLIKDPTVIIEINENTKNGSQLEEKQTGSEEKKVEQKLISVPDEPKVIHIDDDSIQFIENLGTVPAVNPKVCSDVIILDDDTIIDSVKPSERVIILDEIGPARSKSSFIDCEAGPPRKRQRKSKKTFNINSGLTIAPSDILKQQLGINLNYATKSPSSNSIDSPRRRLSRWVKKNNNKAKLPASKQNRHNQIATASICSNRVPYIDCDAPPKTRPFKPQQKINLNFTSDRPSNEPPSELVTNLINLNHECLQRSITECLERVSAKSTSKAKKSTTHEKSNKVGSNVYNPTTSTRTGLRLIVIDGSNVAMGHSNNGKFSCEGLKICIDYFLKRGHEVKAFVPQYRRSRFETTNPELLELLAKQGNVIFTPSRRVKGRRIVPYDDRYIVQCAAEHDGIIVSNDNYRDLHAENPNWRQTIDKRLLMWTWCGDMIMFPMDPCGRYGPTLEQFLRF